MIDHTGHLTRPHPKKLEKCRANGGTGFIGKIGAHAPVANKSDHGVKPHVPQGPVNVKPAKPPTPPAVQKGDTVPKAHGVAKPAAPAVKHSSHIPPPVSAPKPASTGQPTARAVTPTVRLTPKNFDKNKMQLKDGNGNWRTVGSVEVTKPGTHGSLRARYSYRDKDGSLIRSAPPNEKARHESHRWRPRAAISARERSASKPRGDDECLHPPGCGKHRGG